MNFHSGIVMRPLVVIILEISSSYLFCCSAEYDRRTRARSVMLPKQWLWGGCSQQQLELHDFDEWYQLQTCNHLSTTADYLKLLLNLFENMAHFTVILHFYRFPSIPFLRGSRARLTVLVHLARWYCGFRINLHNAPTHNTSPSHCGSPTTTRQNWELLSQDKVVVAK